MVTKKEYEKARREIEKNMKKSIIKGVENYFDNKLQQEKSSDIEKIKLKGFQGIFYVHKNKKIKFENELEYTEKYLKKNTIFEIWNKKINKTGELRLRNNKKFQLSDFVEMIK